MLADFQAAVRDAASARLLVLITAHFRASRLIYLREVISELATFPVLRMDVTVLTNTDRADEIAAMREAACGLRSVTLSIHSLPVLPDPLLLAWCHKPLIVSEFLEGMPDYTHLICLEDDTAFSFANFTYFLTYREKLRDHGLLPAFHRYEISGDGLYFSTDGFVRTGIHNRRHVLLDGLNFMNVENPYQGMFIMDRELVVDYVNTRSFDLERSAEVHTWWILERAQMGLCWEAVPSGFFTRYVVPVHPTTRFSPRFCWIQHLPNTYVNDPNHPAGKVRMDRMFAPEEHPTADWAKIKSIK